MVKSKFNLKKLYSKVFSILIILLILVITFIIILYARGYQFNFKNFTLTSSGIIRVNSTPQNAKIYLKGKYLGTSPLIINSLSPGTYKVSLSLSNYTNWSSMVTVKTGDITNVDAFLIPNNAQENPAVTNANIYKVIYSNSSNYIYVINDINNIYKLYYIDTASQQGTFQLSYIANLTSLIKFNGKGSINVVISNTLNYAIIQYNNENYLYDIVSNKMINLYKLTYFNNLSDISIESYYIIFEENSMLVSFNILTGQTYLLSTGLPSSSSYYSYEILNYNQIIFYKYNSITNETSIFISNLDGSSRRVISSIKGNVVKIFLNNYSSYIAVSNNLGENYLIQIKQASMSAPVKFANGYSLVNFEGESDYVLAVKNNVLYGFYVNDLSEIKILDNYSRLYGLQQYVLGSYIFFQLKNKNNTFSVYQRSIGSKTNHLLTSNSNGTYFISNGGNYLFFNYPYLKDQYYLYFITLIQNTNILPFSL